MTGEKKNEFQRVVDAMGIDVSVLPVLLGMNRSTVHKYLSGVFSDVPAASISLIRLIHLINERSPELLREWMVLQEFSIAGEHYLKNPELYRALLDSHGKMSPSVRKFLEGEGNGR